MKHLTLLLFIGIILCFDGCVNKHQMEDPLSFESKIIPNGFELFDSDVFYVKYNNKINGYDVRIAVKQYDSWEQIVYGDADIAFYKGDTLFMMFNNPYFRIDSVEVKPDTVISLDYKFPNVDMTKKFKLSEFRKLPFFFLDIDFDGQQELLLTYANQAQRGSNAFMAYGLQESSKGYYYDYLYDEIRNVLPYQDLDDLSTIDYQKKEISTTSYGGYYDTKKQIYARTKDKVELHRIEDYDSLGWVLARRQIFHIDTITTYHNGREYLYKNEQQ